MKYGFVYVWRDRKNKMFYVGCHWGSESDRYVCSSERMRSAYRRRPKDFKRRIVARVYGSRQTLLAEEHKWLSQIKNEELGKRYYNLNKHHFGHWSSTDRAAEVSEKLRGKTRSKETKDRMRSAAKTRMWITDGVSCKRIQPSYDIPEGWRRGRYIPALKGKKRPREVIDRAVATRKATSGWSHSEEARKKMSLSHSNKQLSEDHKLAISNGMKGKPSNNPSGKSPK